MIDARRTVSGTLCLCQQSRVQKPAKGDLDAVVLETLSA
jgi:hypothetical protein